MPAQTLPYETTEAIRLRKSQYCRLADTNDWAAWHDLFLPTAKATFHNPDWSVVNENGVHYSFDNRDDLTAFFSKAFETQQTIHVTGPGELTRINDDEVRAIWPAIYHAASHGTSGGWTGTGGGHYHEVWKKVDGEWFIGDFKFMRGFWKVQTLGGGA